MALSHLVSGWECGSCLSSPLPPSPAADHGATWRRGVVAAPQRACSVAAPRRALWPLARRARRAQGACAAGTADVFTSTPATAALRNGVENRLSVPRGCCDGARAWSNRGQPTSQPAEGPPPHRELLEGGALWSAVVYASALRRGGRQEAALPALWLALALVKCLLPVQAPALWLLTRDAVRSTRSSSGAHAGVWGLARSPTGQGQVRVSLCAASTHRWRWRAREACRSMSPRPFYGRRDAGSPG
jgi:hypothetical protein